MMVLDTPFFIMVSVPVSALNLIVVPDVAGPAPNADVPKSPLPAVGVAVWPKSPVLWGCPKSPPPVGVAVAPNEPNCGRGWPKAVDVAPNMPVPGACCGVLAPNMDVLVCGAPKPKPGVAEVAGCPNVEVVVPKRLVFWAAFPNRPPLVLGAVAPNADPPNTLLVCPNGAGCVVPKALVPKALPVPNPFWFPNMVKGLRQFSRVRMYDPYGRFATPLII